MTKSEIIPSRTDVLSMAREADREWDCDRDMVEWLEWFAALIASRVAAASASVEREACAKVCEANRYEGYVPPEDGAAADYYDSASMECADAIRARGQE